MADAMDQVHAIAAGATPGRWEECGDSLNHHVSLRGPLEEDDVCEIVAHDTTEADARAIVTLHNLHPFYEGVVEAARAVRECLTIVPPGAGRLGFLVAPGKGRAFEVAAADLVAALDALRTASAEEVGS